MSSANAATLNPTLTPLPHDLYKLIAGESPAGLVLTSL
jgi:hypothetical protein